MANVKQGGIIKKAQEARPAPSKSPVMVAFENMLNSTSVKERFEKMLGENAGSYLASLQTVYVQNPKLQECPVGSVFSSAAIAASLRLPIIGNLGRAYIVPYKGVASFQIGYLGLVELAQRSGLYKFINVVTVYEGEVQSFNKFTEKIEYGEKESDLVIGYCAAFELLNGFRKTVYWTKGAVEAHAAKYSPSYRYPSSPWQTSFNAMAEKTVLAFTLRHWGPLSVEMQKALAEDPDIQEKPLDLSVDATVQTIEEEQVETSDGRVVDTTTGEVTEDTEQLFQAD